MEKIVQFEISDEEFDKFECFSGVKWKINGEYSILFLADLMAFNELFNISSDDVLMTLNHYERGLNYSGTKSPSVFKRMPLKGLYHIHFYSPQYMTNNINIELGKNGLQDIISDVLDNYKDFPADKKAEIMTERAISDSLEFRREKVKMTGEWVIYAKYKGKNYYLCLARHSDDDYAIRKRIEKHCFDKFPFLKDILVPLEHS
ncbi:hypothetical protein [Aliivibrio fischeri]|uniref:hypothetical protein n=1 Tax=Aliivibrio fischeri TaxID=668 RepID=UPI00080EBA5F|nr:hypothetical protein [Aliivibrio fischeri]OCH04010.1 hypothetical protein A6E10_13715 [Aliivibrio fischeri]